MATHSMYLGDGVHARFDGETIELRADGPKGEQLVYLEPEVWASLLLFMGQFEDEESEG